MIRLIYLLFLSMMFFISCQKENSLIINNDLPDIVDVRYEINMDQPELYYLNIIYTNGESYYDLLKKEYINIDKITIKNNLDVSNWFFETKVKKGAILYIGANVTSKENISASKPGNLLLRIFINDHLEKEVKSVIHASCEYIYGVKYQDDMFYIYSK